MGIKLPLTRALAESRRPLSARAAAWRALLALEKRRGQRLRDALDEFGLRGREQALAYELAHGVVRREKLLDHVLGGLARRGMPKDPALRCALRLGAYQLLFTDGMPAYSAVNETVSLIQRSKGFANALLRRIAERVVSDGESLPAGERLPLGRSRWLRLPQPLPTDEADRFAVLYSLPRFLIERWLREFGSEAVERIGLAASTVPPVTLRVTPGVDLAALQERLSAEGVNTEPGDADGFLRWVGGERPFDTAPFRAGSFVAQDPTAFAAAAALPCGPGDSVVDLCAAPGTKTTWLASKVRPGGMVSAFDPDATRRKRIDENIARLELGDVARVVSEVEELEPARAVLADVPCSNTGVLGRRVEVRRRLTEATFARMAVLQRTLLEQALQLVEPGGHAVYSTCSIDREENEGVVEGVLADRVGDFEVARSECTLPLAGAHAGGFFAVIRRR